MGRRDRAVGPVHRFVGRAGRRRVAPPRRRAVGRRRPGLVPGRARRPRRGLAGARHRLRRDRPGNRPLAVRRRLRRRRLRSVQRTPTRAVDDDAGRRHRGATRGGSTPPPDRRPAAARCDDPQPRRVGLGLLHTPRPLPRPPVGRRAVDRRAACPPDRRRPVRRRPARRRRGWVPRPGRRHRGAVRRARPWLADRATGPLPR